MGRPNGGLRTQSQAPLYSGNTAPAPQPNKNSVLDKFKLFNNKDKNQERGKACSGVSKRTSSSSGFSSARSEHSDSSTSLCDQSKAQIQESPKSRALKSKLQSAKPAKQASPKSGRKEQSSKTQSKIARTSKGPPSSSEKLTTTTYNNAVVVDQDTKINKVVGTKLSGDRKTPNLQELMKQPLVPQSPKLNPSALTPPRQITPQDTKSVTLRNELPTTKASPRPKMELPGKIPDPKSYLHSIKPPPNGLNKEMMIQKAILANTNGIIKPSEPEMLACENDDFNRTLSMNQANLSDGKDLMSRELEVLEASREEQSGLRNFDSPSKTQTSDRDKVIAEEEVESVSEKQESITSNHVDQAAEDAKPMNIEEQQPTSDSSAQNNLNFGPNKPLAGSSSPFHGANPAGAGLSPSSSIPKPTALVKGTSKPSKENTMSCGVPTPTKPKGSDTLHRKLDPNTVAMVSPMPSISDLMSESSHSNSNSTGQSNSSDSSVIYRPSSESGSEIKTIPNRKIDTTFEQMEKVCVLEVFIVNYKIIL